MSAGPTGAVDRGRVARVAGPLVVVDGLATARLYDVARVGDLELLGEIVRLDGGRAVLQVYEDTTGLKVGDPVVGTGAPLEVELGPGLLGTVFDGIQRPLTVLATGADGAVAEPFVRRGARAPALDPDRRWAFTPTVADGQPVGPGDVLGTVAETARITHRVLVPPGVRGPVHGVRAGDVAVGDVVARVGDTDVGMRARWPVRRPRPVAHRLDPEAPLVTGLRVVDTLFPLALGGTAMIPGGFGTGKTVFEQSLAGWAQADVVVYVACGERGNELADMLEEFPRLADPRTGAPVMERTIIVANTSNMPVAAREASVYTGMTLAEYYRDQGYDVLLLADSTSRWAEALREISGRLEEMPGEEGYPAYLPSRLAEFYERAGPAVALGRDGRSGSVSVVGAVSPPGADFTEPVTQFSQRLAGTFWALDTDLARRRHYPAVQWTRSFTHYDLRGWFSSKVAEDWEDQRAWVLATLQEEQALLEIVQLLGSDGLAPREHVVLRTGRLLRDGFLQQPAFDPVDAFCPLEKQHRLVCAVRHAAARMLEAVARGTPVERVTSVPSLAELTRLRDVPPADVAACAGTCEQRLDEELCAP